jgi:hypothetical protein
MMSTVTARSYLVSRALSLSAHESFDVDKSEVPHPLAMGFERSLGIPEGQLADYRFGLADGKGVHVREFGSFFRVHWDRVHPTLERWWDHLREDTPELALILVIGMVVALLLAFFWLVNSMAKRSGNTA